MRIAIFHNLPSGGAKRTMGEQMKRLAARHELDVFTLSCAEHDFCDLRPFAQEYKIWPFSPLPLRKSPFGRINQLLRLTDLIRLRRVEKSIAAYIESRQYDVVYVQPCQYTNSPAILRFLSVPTVFFCHEILRQVYDPRVPSRVSNRRAIQQALDHIDPLPRIYYSALAREDRKNLRTADRVLVNSGFSEERFTQVYDIHPDVCYHGVDIEKFRPLELSRQPQVISVGALHLNKGFDFLIESLALIPSSYRPSLVIVSNHQNPHEWSYLECLAQEVGVELETQLLVSDDELVRLYNQSLLTLYAPVFEPFGLVPLESMACGTPVVGVAEGGVRETIVDGVTGILVDRDEELFAQAVGELLKDDQSRTRYGQLAREHVMGHWTWEAAITRLERHLVGVATVP